jgi:DHA3 family tetracycline resistance protein-like MFS transporter
MSGAAEAWISDEIGEARAAQAFVRAAQVRALAGIIGIFLSVALASVQLNLPFIAAGMLFVLLAGFLLLVMPERGFQPRAEHRSALLTTARDGFRLVRMRPALLVILGVAFVYAFHSEGFDLLWQKHILDHFTLPSLGALDSVAWFGVIGLGANLLGMVVSEMLRRRADLSNHHAAVRALMILYTPMSAGIIGFALAGDFVLAVGLYWMVIALQTAAKPISLAWLNQHVQPEIRATLFSMYGQVGAIGETLGGPPVGLIGRWFSLRAALAFSGFILALALPLLARVQQRETTAQVVETC